MRGHFTALTRFEDKMQPNSDFEISSEPPDAAADIKDE